MHIISMIGSFGTPKRNNNQVDILDLNGQRTSFSSRIQRYPYEISRAMGALLNGKPVVCGGTTTGFNDGSGAKNGCQSLFNCQWSPVSQLREPRYQGDGNTGFRVFKEGIQN